MSREKIKVPGKVYEELIALQREIHFTQDHQDTIKKAQDRGYMNAANWIRQNENAYKIGFAWGFEPSGDEPKGILREIPEKEATAPKRTISRPPPPQNKKSQKSTSTGGIFAGIRKWLGKYF
jgi:hypothetical protein